MSAPLISLVIPAYNEESLLPALLESVHHSMAEWSHGPEAVEIIVANNASTDRTAQVARSANAIVIDVPVRGIGAARNGGAAIAQGRVLCFVDADSYIQPKTFRCIAAAMSGHRVAGGATGVRPEHWSLPLRLMAAMTLPARLLGIDSGVVFCDRSHFVAINGYQGDLLVAEDVDFLWRLRQHARQQHQRLLRLSGVEAITSTRKFAKYGHWRFFAALGGLAISRAVSPRRFLRSVQRYWYEDR